MKRLINLTIFSFLFCQMLSAQTSDGINTITTAVPFLRIASDERACGMGEIGIATSPDVHSTYWNPGKVPFNKCKGGIAASYSPWMRDITNDMFLASIDGYYKLSDTQAIHGSLRYFSLGDLQFTDNLGNNYSTFRPRELSFNLGYSRRLSNNLGIGIGLKYIYSKIAGSGAGGNDSKAGNAVAADLGLYYNAQNNSGNGWSFGGALANLGSKISYSDNADEKYFIPANLGLGAAYTKIFDDQNKVVVGIDINKLLVPTPPTPGDSAAMASYRSKSVIGSWFSSFGDAPDGFDEEIKEFQVSLGGEYWYNNQFAFRAGYFFENKGKGNRRFFSMGAGVSYKIFTLNFSYLFQTGSGIDRSPLSNTMRFGLAIDLLK